MGYIIIKKDWEVRNFGSNEYYRILEFHYELVSKSIGYYSDGYTRRFLEECKVKLPTLRLGAAQMAAAKTSGGGQANFFSYAHHAVCVLFGNAVMAILGNNIVDSSKSVGNNNVLDNLVHEIIKIMDTPHADWQVKEIKNLINQYVRDNIQTPKLE